MRVRDVRNQNGNEAWRVPLDRVEEWVKQHPEKMHRASRGDLFALTWRDLWYLRMWLSGGDMDDETAKQGWMALSLRDLRWMPHYPRVYEEAEWELFCELIPRREPPVNGDGLFDQLDLPPVLVYQFHGLSDRRVLDCFDTNETIAVYAVEMLLAGKRPEHEMATYLSAVVNHLRAEDGLRPLTVAGGSLEASLLGGFSGTGMLCENEDGTFVTAVA